MSPNESAQQHQFDLLTSHLPIMVAHCDRELRFKYANEAYAERFGLSAAELVGRLAEDVVGPDAVRAIRPYVEQVLRGERVEYETWVPYRTLGRRYMRCIYSPEFDAAGQPVGYVAGILDETARKTAEEALSASRARFDFVATSADIGVWSCDVPLFELIWNSACKSHFGLPPEASVTIDTFYERMHHDDVARTRVAIDEALNDGRPYDVEYRTRQQDGSFRWIRAIGRADYDERGLARRFEGITLDVHDQKHAEAALRDSRDRLRAALDASRTGTFRWDLDTNALDWDDNLDRLFGLQPGSTAQSLPEFVRLVHPDDRERVIDACARCASEHADFVEEFRVVWPDGSVRWLFDQGRVQVGPNGHRYMIGACVDITERRTKEDALRAADRQKDEFLGMLAHEIRNPLAPMVYSASILERRVEDPALKRPLEVIHRQAARMIRIVDDLLDVSRVTQGKIALQRERVSVATLLTQSVDAARPMFDARGHTLTLHPVDAAHAILGDPVRLAQITENLLINAAKYTPDGGRIDVSASIEGRSVTIAVADTGIGITADMLGRVFDLFAQADTSLDRSEGGLGIGLTLVDRLARMHGGSVHASSGGLGHGSTFTVSLPLMDAPVREASQRRELRQAVSRRVLVVDDNRDSTDMLQALIALSGHTVLVANDGAQAVRLAREAAPEIVLLDLGLPGKDGYRVIEELRAVPGLASATIVATTGYGRQEDRARCLAAGFDHHMTKPIDFEELQQLLGATEPA